MTPLFVLSSEVPTFISLTLLQICLVAVLKDDAWVTGLELQRTFLSYIVSYLHNCFYSFLVQTKTIETKMPKNS